MVDMLVEQMGEKCSDSSFHASFCGKSLLIATSSSRQLITPTSVWPNPMRKLAELQCQLEQSSKREICPGMTDKSRIPSGKWESMEAFGLMFWTPPQVRKA